MGKSVQEFSPLEKLTMDEFKKYLQTVSELNAVASRILEWCDKNIWSVVGGPQIGEAKIPFNKWPEEIKKIVVSGLKVEQYKSPYYATNAYAKFIEDFLGVKLDSKLSIENVRKLLFEIPSIRGEEVERAQNCQCKC